MRYIPTPGHTKLWQERTPLAQYINNEVQGTRMRRWEPNKLIHDFLMPYVRGGVQRATGEVSIPGDVQVRRDLNTLADTLQYLRGLRDSAQGDQVSPSCRNPKTSRTRARDRRPHITCAAKAAELGPGCHSDELKIIEDSRQDFVPCCLCADLAGRPSRVRS